jgi:hypothetical protein
VRAPDWLSPDKPPSRVAGVFFFACNTDPSGTRPFQLTPIIQRCLNRHTKDNAELSSTPDQFKEFSDAVGAMQGTQPNYSPSDLAEIGVSVAIVQGEHDEFDRAGQATRVSLPSLRSQAGQ